MESTSSDTETPFSTSISISNPNIIKKTTSKKRNNSRHEWRSPSSSSSEDEKEMASETEKEWEMEAEAEAEAEDETKSLSGGWKGDAWMAAWPRRLGRSPSGTVMLEGYVEAPQADGEEVGLDGGGGSLAGRTKSLTDDDLEELKGCLDLGFGFSYNEIPELCNTLPALELCHSMSRSLEVAAEQPSPGAQVASPPITNWKISSPGDDPEEVKARLKYWAQAVACTVKLCN